MKYDMSDFMSKLGDLGSSPKKSETKIVIAGKPDEGSDDKKDMRLSAMADLIDAIKSGDAEKALEAYDDLCDPALSDVIG